MIEIITIGDEILIGQIIDTNSAWMSATLNKSGFEVSKITSIHDNEEQITTSLDTALNQNRVVLITGGLGPTKDDITKQTLCKYFNTRLIHNEEVSRHIQALYAHNPSVMNTLTESQAMVPESSVVIQNTVGTAPIMWFESNGKVVVSMPGVPFEMKTAMIEQVIPRLISKFAQKSIVHRTVQVYGYSESALAIKIAAWEKHLPTFLRLAYLPTFGIVKLRLSGISNNSAELENSIAQQFESLKHILSKNIIAQDDLPFEYALHQLLKERDETITFAESCTGGNIAHRVTLIPGSSAVFKGAIIAYDNLVKQQILSVSKQTLLEHGAVSQPVVEQMADSARKLLNTDWAVAVSGIAGPDGGTDEKPVGTVWMAVAGTDYMQSRKMMLGSFPRDVIIERASVAALMMAFEAITNHT